MLSLSRRAAIGLACLVALAGCGGSFKTSYESSADPAVSRGWRLAAVSVAVPETLTVSEAKTVLPRADIVWREDPAGDRRAQVATIMETAVRQGAAGLRGSRPVRIELTMARFHALTFEAESRNWGAGVHDVEFTAQVVDAGSGAVLFGPQYIQASLPAFSGAEATAARMAGRTQKGDITAHVARTMAGWLGLGPDPRGSFNRVGG